MKLMPLIAVAIALGVPAHSQTTLSKPPPTSFGRIEHHSYITSIGQNLPNHREEYYVYTPPNYDKSKSRSYPVLYLLHGYSDRAFWWVTQARIQSLLDELISGGKVQPMLVVMPACYGDYRFLLLGQAVWGDNEFVSRNGALFSKMLLDEIIPRVENSYRVSEKREDRAIAGFSMGGREAITTALAHPSEFSWVGGFSSAFPINFPLRRFNFPLRPNFRLLWIGYGADDHYVERGNTEFIAALNARGIANTTVPTSGKHEESVWRDDFRRFVPLLFQPK